MTRSVNIVTGNHAGYRGISDWVHYLKFTLTKLDCDVTESILPKANVDVNFWIEEFASFNGEFDSVNGKNVPPFFIVCTEYLSSSRAFNVFSRRERIFSLILLLFPVRFIVKAIFVPDHRLGMYVGKLLSVLLVSLGYLLGFSARATIWRVELSARFVSLKKYVHKAAGLIVVNDAFKSSYNKHFPDVPVHILTPLLDESWISTYQNVGQLDQHQKVNCWAFLSGSMPKFRTRWSNRIFLFQQRLMVLPNIFARNILSGRLAPDNLSGRLAPDNLSGRLAPDNLSGRLAPDNSMISRELQHILQEELSFSSGVTFIGHLNSDNLLSALTLEARQKNLFFEIYIGQTKAWKDASPLREYRAFRQGCIPINAGTYESGIFGAISVTAPKAPKKFIEFIHGFDGIQAFASTPALIEAHNARFLPINKLLITAITLTTSKQ